MKKQIQIILWSLFLFSGVVIGQTVQLEGYIFEDNNRGFLNEVNVDIYEASKETFITKSTTNVDGLFTAELPAGKDYILKISKDLFFPKEEMASTKGKTAGQKAYAKIKLERKPGYIFDVTLAEKGAPKATVNAITGAKVEVFNNTTMEEILATDSLAGINFDVTFERGNHYTVLIRKEGFFNKRLEAYVDVEGCILCFEGVGTVTPGVSDVMSEGFQMGSVLANIELEPANLNRTIEVENIYYDLDKYFIRDDAAVELDKVVRLLKDNPAIIIELGSHTDSRGGTRHNMQLSSNRAKAAVDYIVESGGVDRTRISAKGYGETALVNGCKDGVKCSEAQHQKNRRTELKIVGFEAIDPLENRSLADMLLEEKLLQEVLNSEQIQVSAGEIPDFDKLNAKSSIPANSKNKGGTTTKASSPVATNKQSTAAVKTEIKETTIPKASSISTAKESTATTVKSTIKETSTASSTATPNPKETESASIISITEATDQVMAKGKEDKLIQHGETDVTPITKQMLTFEADKIMIVQDRKVELVTKMLGNQLNTRITDLLIAQKVSLETPKGLMTYKFDSIDKMPVDLLNVFLNKLAMVKQADGWQLFPLREGDALPKAVMNALK